MNYAPLIEKALSTLDVRFSLADLLDQVDALNHSVPTLEELNTAFAQIQADGRWPSFDWSPVSKAAYDEALFQNHERMATFLESRGISRERQHQVLQELGYKSHET